MDAFFGYLGNASHLYSSYSNTGFGIVDFACKVSQTLNGLNCFFRVSSDPITGLVAAYRDTGLSEIADISSDCSGTDLELLLQVFAVDRIVFAYMVGDKIFIKINIFFVHRFSPLLRFRHADNDELGILCPVDVFGVGVLSVTACCETEVFSIEEV